MIRVAETFDQFQAACRYRDVNTSVCSHPKKINPVCLDKKYCPRTEANDKKEKAKNRPEWWDNFTIYYQIHEEQFTKLIESTEWIKEMEDLYPGVDIPKSMLKARNEYWATESGWDKRRGTSKTLDFKTTYRKALGYPFNQVQKSEKSKDNRWRE